VNTLSSDNKPEREVEQKRAGLSFFIVNLGVPQACLRRALGTPAKFTSALAELS